VQAPRRRYCTHYHRYHRRCRHRRRRRNHIGCSLIRPQRDLRNTMLNRALAYSLPFLFSDRWGQLISRSVYLHLHRKGFNFFEKYSFRIRAGSYPLQARLTNVDAATQGEMFSHTFSHTLHFYS
jgi:hypothetical protein